MEVDHDVSNSAHVEVDTSNVTCLLSIQDVLVDCVEVQNVPNQVLKEGGNVVVECAKLCLLHEDIFIDAVGCCVALTDSR